MSLNSNPAKYFTIIVIASILSITVQSYGQDSTKTVPVNKSLSLEDSIKKRYGHYQVDFPQEAKEKGISGIVIITFDVDSTCSITNRKIKEGIGYGCDEAALSVLDRMEKNIKKTNKSKCIPRSETFPVKFKSL